MNPSKTWKRAFDAWESTTARYLEAVAKNPLILRPAGLMLTAVMRSKAASDKAAATWWGSLGLPTKRDQERLLHAVNQLESRLIDLEDQLAETRS